MTLARDPLRDDIDRHINDPFWQFDINGLSNKEVRSLCRSHGS